MDWLQIIATDPYWFQGLFLGVLPYLIFGQWFYVIAWLLVWIFLGSAAHPGYSAAVIILMLVFIQARVRGLLFSLGSRRVARV